MTTEHLSPAEFRKRVARHVPECDTQDAILQWLALMKVRAVRIDTAGQPVYGKRINGKMPTVMGMTPCAHVGMPDIYAPLPWGQACHIEVKRAGQGKLGLRYSQAKWIVETARLSPLTMILIAESRMDVEEIVKPMLDDWEDRSEFELFNCDALWRIATARAVELAKLRLAKGPQ